MIDHNISSNCELCLVILKTSFTHSVFSYDFRVCRFMNINIHSEQLTVFFLFP